jgi:HD superfamily phosphohydrolase
MITNNYKIVRDPIHGNIQIKNYFVDLLETPEIQRLYNIKQLGFAHLVFPGAHHTRLEHSLGVYKIAAQISDILELDEYDKKILTTASFLHDIGHGPFSHTLESILLEKFGVDHIDLTEKLILGEYDIIESKEKKFIDSPSVNQILEKEGLNKKELIRVIRGNTVKKSFLSQILNSTIDADQLDYLVRDAYYTGVAYGLIDIERLLQTFQVFNNNLTINRKGVGVMENILMARGLMYSSVYFHKTVRIAELMLSKAIEDISEFEPFEFFRMTDAEILNSMKNMGDFQNEIITRLKYRKLFKQAYVASFYELEKHEIKLIDELEITKKRRQKESELEQSLNIEKGHVIIDAPHLDLIRAEPRISKTEIPVVDNNEIYTLDDYTPVAKAIRSRLIPDWMVMVVTDEKYRDIVSKKAEKILFS